MNILTNLLQFEMDNITLLIQHVSQLSQEVLVNWSNTQVLFRLVCAFFTCSGLSSRVKQSIWNKFDGNFATLAHSKYASYVVTEAYKFASLEKKQKLVAELADPEVKKSLLNTKHGLVVLKICGVDKFIRNKEAWANSERKQNKKEELFREIIEFDPEKEVQESLNKSGKSEKKRKRDQKRDLLSDAIASFDKTVQGDSKQVEDEPLSLKEEVASTKEEHGEKKKKKKKEKKNKKLKAETEN